MAKTLEAEFWRDSNAWEKAECFLSLKKRVTWYKISIIANVSPPDHSVHILQILIDQNERK